MRKTIKAIYALFAAIMTLSVTFCEYKLSRIELKRFTKQTTRFFPSSFDEWSSIHQTITEKATD